MIVYWELVYIYFYRKKAIASFKTREKMIGHHTRLREDDNFTSRAS